MNSPPRAPARLTEMTAATWSTSRSFAFAFEWTLWLRDRAAPSGAETRLYAICEEDGAFWKFGIAKDPRKRLADLQIGSARELLLYAHAPAQPWIEKLVHHTLRRQRVRGEWFKASPRTLTIAHLIEVAYEQIWDAEGLGDEPCITEDTIAALCSRFDEAEATVRRRAAA